MQEYFTAQSYGFGTKAIHAGQPADPVSGAVMIPISLSTTFQQATPGVTKGYEYSRSGNPTRNALEANIAACENAKYGAAFASGLAASLTVLSTVPSGSEVLVADDVYGGTRRLFSRVLQNTNNLKFTYIDFSVENALDSVINENVKLIWVETPTNPTMKIFDIKAISEKAHTHNIRVVVDNTFMTPFFQKPLDLGADVVVHSVTKYLNGHSDVVMGIVLSNDQEFFTQLRYLQNALGAIPSPFDCYLVLRGMKTLHVRMPKHAENAAVIAKLLEQSSKVEKVVYPGLASHSQHELAKRQMTGFGGMVTFFLKGGLAESRRFLENLKLFALAESLGAVESLADHPAIMTHASIPPAARAELGISDSLIRLSVGIEDITDLVADIQNALSHV